MTPTVPGSPKGPFLGLPRGTMRRQKSIGKECDPHPKTLPLSFQLQLSVPLGSWLLAHWLPWHLDPNHSPPGLPTRGQMPSLSLTRQPLELGGV